MSNYNELSNSNKKFITEAIRSDSKNAKKRKFKTNTVLVSLDKNESLKSKLQSKFNKNQDTDTHTTLSVVKEFKEVDETSRKNSVIAQRNSIFSLNKKSSKDSIESLDSQADKENEKPLVPQKSNSNSPRKSILTHMESKRKSSTGQNLDEVIVLIG